MRTAAICPTCATFTNAICVLYDGPYLQNIEVAPLDPISDALDSIDSTIGDLNIIIGNLAPQHGTGGPISSPNFIGQLYVDTAAPAIYYAKGTTFADWVQLANN